MNGCIYRTADDKCDFWSDHGKGIVSYCDFDGCEEKKPSNADRIRAMTDEKLADTIAHKADACLNCTSDGLDTCKSCWLDWLKQEASDGKD